MTVVGPRGQQSFPVLPPRAPSPKLRQCPGRAGRRSGLPRRSPRPASAHALSAVLPPGRTFAKVCLPAARSPPAARHARGSLPRFRTAPGRTCAPRDMHFTARAFTVKAREPGLGTGLSFPPQKGARGAGLSRGAGRGLTRIPDPEPPLAPAPNPRRVLPQGRPTPWPAPASPEGQQLPGGVASPRAGSHSPWAFTFSPRPCWLLRRVSRSRRRRRRASRGPDERRLLIHAAGAEREARGQRARSPGARGRASAGLELQPPPFRSSPHRRPARGSRAGAPTGDPWRPPAEWQLREVRSPGGSSCLLRR